jgi:hypothetical protein
MQRVAAPDVTTGSDARHLRVVLQVPREVQPLYRGQRRYCEIELARSDSSR